MASTVARPSPVTPETPITLKVNFNGVTRRFKVPLRELAVNHIEATLRNYLQIPIGTAATFERYSDSASSYVVLAPGNVQVYKQLHRAAKAKQKIKLRVQTVREETPVEQHPVAVPEAAPENVPEDAPENTPEVTHEFPTDAEVPSSNEQPSPPPSVAKPSVSSGASQQYDSIVAPTCSAEFDGFICEWKARGMPRIIIEPDSEGVDHVKFVYRDGEPSRSSMYPSGASLDSTLLTSSPSEEKTYEQLLRIDALTEIARARSERRSVEQPAAKSPTLTTCYRRPFTVACNSCDKPVTAAHFHCSTCDEGDFDLCQSCVDQGITCRDDNHWLIKRTIEDGQIVYSTTHVAPKKLPTRLLAMPIRTKEPAEEPAEVPPVFENTRTCNSCVGEFPEAKFLHCTACSDFDLCEKCFMTDHGHHPKHAFKPAVASASFAPALLARLTPGRNVAHNAICDGCDKNIKGIRHKCLVCPDWDFCSECEQNAAFIHAGHRFAAIYEPLDVGFPTRLSSMAVHTGICCDGPLCKAPKTVYIRGDRYKCAVCADTDFCANCEASPVNTHNKTHPLIKFKTPIRHVNVSTTGEHGDGRRMPMMGDGLAKCPRNNPRPSDAASFASPSRETIAATPVQTVVDVKPSNQECVKPAHSDKGPQAPTGPSQENLVEAKENGTIPSPDLIAFFKRDQVADGTVMPPGQTFEQTWVMRNGGDHPWPAGCSVKFVGGDYMGAVDPSHPAGIGELVSASESTVCYSALAPGQEFPFTVLMRTPEHEGKAISYWRLTTADGIKFGHKIWCDVNVEGKLPSPSAPECKSPEPASSQMIIPTLQHESPEASMHEESLQSEAETQTETDTVALSEKAIEDDFEVCGEEDSWVGGSDDGFLTDEEYDILDASD